MNRITNTSAEKPEYTGSIFTSIEPLTPSERLALFQFRWPEPRFYRVLPARKPQRARS